MTNELSKEQEKRLDEAFFLIDQDNDKAISINEVGLLLRALGIFISESDIEKMKSKLGNEGELVSYDEFKKIYKKRLKTNLSGNDLIDAFKYFDEGENGKINLEQIKHGLMTLGEPLSEEEFKILEEDLDLDEEGNIDYNELANKIYGNKK